MGRHCAKGGTLVEFTVVAGVFYLTLFSIIEFGRVLYTWNVLDEITRRGARLAAVCPIASSAGITSRSTFNGGIIHDLAADNLKIEYLDGDAVPINDTNVNFVDIRFVRASIEGYQFQAFIPFISLLLPAPSFATVLPSESLGISPPGAVVGGGNINC